MNADAKILVVDDEDMVLLAIESTLQLAGYESVISCRESRQVPDMIRDGDYGLILLDLNMPHLNGEKLLEMIKESFSEIPVIVITGAVEVETAVRCMKGGAFDYILKPVNEERLLSSVKKALQFRMLETENRRLKKAILAERPEHPEAFKDIVTESRNMFRLFEYAEAIAGSGQPVLITGETGVGKELFAKALHRLSGFEGKPVSINVAGLDDMVFSDSLFGHTRGAFTGADTARKGLVEEAAGGTLFLDEIGDLSSQSQVKLLRLLQEKEYFPLGADIPRIASARIIAATNCDLNERVKEGAFRQDLYYRLMIHQIEVPPLRERKKDIRPLLELFFDEASARMGKKTPAWPPELIGLLSTYHFPGNVRELQGMVYDAVSRHSSRMLSLSAFRRHMENEADVADPSGTRFPDPLPTLKEVATLLIDEALERAGGTQTIAAKMLGISHQALSRRLKERRKEEEG